ncbi:lysozyme [Shewanella subflava]|uniref:Lysozyme n=1 Tax=Shewanella subflava TaxID=2986476 RepID=A0ABT3I5S5_9GAMM|nr:lysozyme [Shewanella subflava]MCW3171420.1 lysozyme [Shewanella subflava]
MNIKSRLMAMGFTGAVLIGGVLVVNSEGEVHATYVDPAGIITACFGHTNPQLKNGMSFTEQQCLDLLADDLSKFDKELDRLSPPLSQGEHAAYLSFIYNVGTKAFADSTLRQKLLADDRHGACNELPRWVYANGKKLPGLINRRMKERRICIKDLPYANEFKR